MKPTLEELKALYPTEVYSIYDLYWALHLAEQLRTTKREHYRKNKEKIIEQIKEVKEEIKNTPAPPPKPESQYPPIIKDTKTKKSKS
jgi:hypothetical protein